MSNKQNRDKNKINVVSYEWTEQEILFYAKWSRFPMVEKSILMRYLGIKNLQVILNFCCGGSQSQERLKIHMQDR